VITRLVGGRLHTPEEGRARAARPTIQFDRCIFPPFQFVSDWTTREGSSRRAIIYHRGRACAAPGETSKTFPVTVKFDDFQEPAETFSVSLSNATNATFADALATGTINNTVPNAAPVAANDAVTLAAGQTSAAINVLGNDTDAENDALTVTMTNAPTGGVAVANSDGTITYTPADATAVAMDSFTYTISDAFGGTDTATVSVTVTGNGTAPNPVDPTRRDVLVAATGGNDEIQVIRVGRTVQILINGQDQGSFASQSTGNIVVSGGEGDNMLILTRVNVPVLFNGGDGDDELGGGKKGDIVIGGPGNDTLNGGAGRDIIIGGDGADTITGLGASDIHIAGTTIYDADTVENRAALNELLGELARGGQYSAKLNTFISAQGVGTSGVRLAANTRVFNDNAVDMLIGGGSAEFFVADTDGGSAINILTKKARNESVIGF
jgi:Ca2+-binding RTX toxin-like protein